MEEIVDVIRIDGTTWATVKGGYRYPGRYSAWIPGHLDTKRADKAILAGETVEAVIVTRKNRATIKNFLYDDKIAEATVKEQRKEYDELTAPY